MVITLDSESSDPGSSPGRTSFLTAIYLFFFALKKKLLVGESNPGRPRDRRKCYQLHQPGCWMCIGKVFTIDFVAAKKKKKKKFFFTVFQIFFSVYKYNCVFLFNSYLLGLLAKIKCSICSYQLNLWYGIHVVPS